MRVAILAGGVGSRECRVGAGVSCGEVPVPVGVRPAVLDGLATPVGVGLTLRVGEPVLDGDVEYVGVGDAASTTSGCVCVESPRAAAGPRRDPHRTLSPRRCRPTR